MLLSKYFTFNVVGDRGVAEKNTIPSHSLSAAILQESSEDDQPPEEMQTKVKRE